MDIIDIVGAFGSWFIELVLELVDTIDLHGWGDNSWAKKQTVGQKQIATASRLQRKNKNFSREQSSYQLASLTKERNLWKTYPSS